MRSSSVLSTAVAVALLTVGACHDDATAPPPVPSLTASTLSVADTAVLADGSASTLVTVHVTDAGGSPITGDVGGVAILTSAGTIGRVSQRGNAYSATLTAPAVSTDARITATLGGQLLAATAKVHFVTLGVSLTKSTFTVADSVLTGDGISTTVATIHLKDALGNAVTSGAGPVTVETTLGAVGAASQPASDTYVAALTAPLASGNATIYARVNGVFLTTTPGVRFRDVADTLVVTVSGLPGGSSTAVTVVGPGSFSRTLNATTTFVDIIPGTYTITGANVLTSGAIYGPAPSSQTVQVVPFAKASSSVTYAVRSDSWSTEEPMPTARKDLAVGVVNGLLYAFGGCAYPCGGYSGFLSTMIAYDPAKRTWTPRASMIAARDQVAGGVLNGILYAVGGEDYDGTWTSIEAYDPSTDTWNYKASMLTWQSGSADGVANGILYAVGMGGATADTTNEAYDPATNTWSVRASMPTARLDLGVGVINGIVYAVGGTDGSTFLSTVEAYDPATNSWTTKAPMPTARRSLAVGVVNGILYAVGGTNLTGTVATVEAYDPATNSWTAKPSMPTARENLAIGVVNGVLYAVGGDNGATGGLGFDYLWLPTVEAYVP